MTISHYQDWQGNHIDLPIGKVVCVGQNYVEHIQEMGSQPSKHPMLFMKPSTSLVDIQQDIAIPQDRGECHNELEVALLIGSTIDRSAKIDLATQLRGVGLALDLTLREVQSQCKQKGHPWERAKSFDGSCPISPFCRPDIPSLQDLHFSLSVNGALRQSGHTAKMIFNIYTLIDEIRQQFTLLPGDIVLTGTPKGVGPLFPGDKIEIQLQSELQICTQVITWD